MSSVRVQRPRAARRFDSSQVAAELPPTTHGARSQSTPTRNRTVRAGQQLELGERTAHQARAHCVIPAAVFDPGSSLHRSADCWVDGRGKLASSRELLTCGASVERRIDAFSQFTLGRLALSETEFVQSSDHSAAYCFPAFRSTRSLQARPRALPAKSNGCGNIFMGR
jgi:hypothetical protein